jgi:hypothetical protein
VRITRTNTKRVAVMGFVLAVFALPWGRANAQSMHRDMLHAADQAAAPQPSTVSPTNVDLRSLRQQMSGFEVLINRNVQQMFEGPFSLLQDAKGIYLPGYGVAFHLEANLYPMRLLSPFDSRGGYSAEELQKAKQDKLARIQQLRSKIGELLLDHGGELNAMAPEQNIAIVIHLFNLPSESSDLPSQLVISINRNMLLDYQNRRLTAAEFQKTGSFLEF